MSNWMSFEGKWQPKNERVALRNNSGEVLKNPSADWSKFCGEEVQAGDEYIYEGPCRQALFEMWDAKTVDVGVDFRTSPDFLQATRNMGFNSVAQYLKAIGYDSDKAKENFEKNSTKVEKHDLPKRVEAINTLGGGRDYSGNGNDIIGAFKTPPGM